MKIEIEKLKIIFKILYYNSISIINNYNFFFLYKIKNIKIKFGIDPSNKNIHLGHLIYFFKILNLLNLKFLKLIIIIGLKTSLNNNFFIKNYIFKNTFYILYNIKFFLKLKNFKFYYNNDWHNFLNVIEKEKIFLNSNFEKYKNLKLYSKIINFYYIIAQSYDSYFIKSNIEMGGLDQKINFLFCYDFLLKNFKNKNFFFLYPLILKNNNYKISKSSFDNFFCINKIIKIFNNLNIKIIDNYIKLIFLKNKNFLKYFLKFFNLKYLKIYFLILILKLIKFKINNFLKFKFKKNIFFLKFTSIIIYKILKIVKFLNKKNYLKNFFYLKLIINNTNILNVNFLILKNNYILKLNKKYIFLIVK